MTQLAVFKSNGNVHIKIYIHFMTEFENVQLITKAFPLNILKYLRYKWKWGKYYCGVYIVKIHSLLLIYF